jgi:tRNA-dihydrouridine synthase
VPDDIPVVGNGDVNSLDDYKRMREQTGCDAVMIGRGARGNPWLFAQIRAYEAGDQIPGPPAIDERVQVFLSHAALIEELRAGPKMFQELRKAVAWYARELPGCNELRKEVWTIREPEAVVERALEFFEHAREGAARAA